MTKLFLSAVLVSCVIILTGCSDTEVDGDTADTDQIDLDISSDFQYSFQLDSSAEQGIHDGANILNEAGSFGTATELFSSMTWTSRFYDPATEVNHLYIGMGIHNFQSLTPTAEELEEFFSLGPRSIIGNPNIEVSIQTPDSTEYSSSNGPQTVAKFEILDIESQFSSFGFQYLKVNLSMDSVFLYSNDVLEDSLVLSAANVVTIFSYHD